MNKPKHLILICILVIATLISGVNVSFADVNMTFEGGTGKWVLFENTGTMSTEIVDSEVCLSVSSDSTLAAFRNTLETPIANDGGIYVLSYDVIIPKINTATGKQTIVIEGHGPNKLNCFYGLRIDNGVISYFNGSGQYSISTAYKYGDDTGSKLTLSENTWHNLKTVYNRTKGVFTYYVDDIPLLDANGDIISVTAYSKVADLDIASLVLRSRNVTDDKVYVKNISLYKTDVDIGDGAVYKTFENGVSEITIRGASSAVSSEVIDEDYGSSMKIYDGGSSATYHEFDLTDKILADNGTYELSYDMYLNNNTSTSKQLLSVVGLDANNVNTFYGLRFDNTKDGILVYYYNGKGQYDVSVGHDKNGNELILTTGKWYHITTVWDRASSIFTYYINGVPVCTEKGDIAKPHVRSSEINKSVSKISVISRNTTTIPAYVDNVYLRKKEKVFDEKVVNIYNLSFVDSNGTVLNPDEISDVTDFSVKFDYDATEDFTAIVALYDGNRLKDVDINRVDVSNSGYTTAGIIDVQNIYDAKTVKFFVWDGMENIMPYKVYTKEQNVEITQKLDAVSIDNEYFAISGDSLTLNGNTVVLKAPVVSSDAKKDSTAGGADTKYYINVTVNDETYQNRKDGIVYEIDIKYYDDGYGCFTIEYDTLYESLKEAEVVELNNTKKWKTHTFVLENPYFTGDGVDFRICTWGELMRYSNCDVCFGRITLRNKGIRDQFDIKTTGNTIGNIYYTGDTATFTTTISNRDFYEYSNTFGSYDATLRYTLLDENKNVVRVIDERTVSIDPVNIKKNITVSFNMDKYGLYYLKTEVINENFELLGEKLTELSYVHSDKTTVNPDYGTSIQVHLYNVSSTDPTKTTNGAENLAKYAGIGMVRYIRTMSKAMSITYDSTGSKLTTNGYDSDWSKYETLMKSNGYTILNNLISAGMTYSNDLVNGYQKTVPHGTTGLDYFKQYCTFFATEYLKRSPDETRYYEIWNEFDSYAGNKFNYNGDDWEYYGDIIVAAADAIYDVDPDAEIVALSSRFVNSHKVAIDRVKELIADGTAKNDLEDYFKHASIHPYHWNDNPMDFVVYSDAYTKEATNIYEHLEILKGIYDSYGLNETKLWISEIAWSPGYINYDAKEAKAITDKQQGSYLVQSYIMSRKNAYKYIPYLFSRQTHVRVDVDRNMGIIKNSDAALVDVPYAATNAYLATANLNMLMTNAKYEEDFFFDDTVRSSTAYRFTKADGKDLAVLWSIYEAGETVSINLGTNSVTMYDEYGNAQTLTSTDGIYELTLTQSTVYLEGDFTTFSKV